MARSPLVHSERGSGGSPSAAELGHRDSRVPQSGIHPELEDEYLAKSKGGSFEFSEAALNLTKDLSEELRVGFQLVLGYVRSHAGAVGYVSMTADTHSVKVIRLR